MAEFRIKTDFIELHPEIVQKQNHETIGAYIARPENDADILAGLVLIQEIFGVNRHFKRLSEHFAKKGYFVMTPAYFDHEERDVALDYDQTSMEKGYGLILKIGFTQMTSDTKTAGETLHKMMSSLPGKKRSVAVVGYCLGGSLAWAVSAKTSGIFSAASSYYGSKLPELKELKPLNPVIAHFGKKDAHIPASGVDAFQKIHPEVTVYWYDAGHGFNCDEKKDFDPASAKLAEERTLAFFTKTLSL